MNQKRILAVVGVIAIILVVVLLMTATSTSSNKKGDSSPLQPSHPTTSEIKSYENIKFGLKFDYPANLDLFEQDVGVLVLFLSPSPGGNASQYLGITVEKNISKSLDELNSDQLPELFGVLEGQSVLSSSKTTFKGLDAYLLTVESTGHLGGSVGTPGEVIFALKDGILYAFMADSFEDPDVTVIMDSFEFI